MATKKAATKPAPREKAFCSTAGKSLRAHKSSAAGRALKCNCTRTGCKKR